MLLMCDFLIPVLSHDITTIDGERFTGLNVRIFNPIEFFTEIPLRCLGQKCLLFKERHLYSQENFLKTMKNANI